MTMIMLQLCKLCQIRIEVFNNRHNIISDFQPNERHQLKNIAIAPEYVYMIIWHAPENAHVQVLPLAFSEKDFLLLCPGLSEKYTGDAGCWHTFSVHQHKKNTNVCEESPLSLSYIAATH